MLLASAAPIPPPVVAPPVVVQPKTWQCPGCTPEEKYVLKTLQEETRISDRNALATILGNIQQESMFISNICEGGARVEYTNCHSGGYGLIQWTTVGRYNGLGRHAAAIGGDPNAIETQLSYLVTEVEWKKVQHIFKREGQSITTYMNAAYRWLGWGVHGARTTYSNEYYNLLTPTK